MARALLSKLLLALFGFALAEAALQVAASSTFIGRHLSGLKPRYVSDPILGVRGDASLPEYDEHGFRNAVRPSDADIVVIGDSQTEGNGVERDSAWPQQLAAMTYSSVYQLAFGGYGPGQYLVLADDALSLLPQVILIAVYLGNDVAGMYRWVYGEGHDQSFVTRNRRRRARLARADRTRPSLDQSWSATESAKSDTAHSPLRAWLQDEIVERSKVIALWKLVSWRLAHGSGLEPRRQADDWEKVRAVAAHVSPDLLMAYEGDGARTVFTPRTRSSTQNLHDPRIREGLRMTLQAIERIRSRVGKRAETAVVLIPTKELVFADRVRETEGGLPPHLAAVEASEMRLRNKTMRFLAARGVRLIDPLPNMRAALDAGRKPYFEDWDGHPAPGGHEAIAKAVAAEVASMATPVAVAQ